MSSQGRPPSDSSTMSSRSRTGGRTLRQAPGGPRTASGAGCWSPTPHHARARGQPTNASRCIRCPPARTSSLTSVLAVRNRQASAATGRSSMVTSNPPRRRIPTPASSAAVSLPATGSLPPQTLPARRRLRELATQDRRLKADVSARKGAAPTPSPARIVHRNAQAKRLVMRLPNPSRGAVLAAGVALTAAVTAATMFSASTAQPPLPLPPPACHPGGGAIHHPARCGAHPGPDRHRPQGPVERRDRPARLQPGVTWAGWTPTPAPSSYRSSPGRSPSAMQPAVTASPTSYAPGTASSDAGRRPHRRQPGPDPAVLYATFVSSRVPRQRSARRSRRPAAERRGGDGSRWPVHVRARRPSRVDDRPSPACRLNIKRKGKG